MEKQKPHSRKKKSLGIGGLAVIGGGSVAVVALIAALTYLQIGRQYKEVFFPNTIINGMDASKKSIDEVKTMVAAGIDGYQLTIKERGDNTEIIKGTDIGMEAVFDGSVEKLLKQQKPLEWAKHIRKFQNFDIGTLVKYNQDQFDAAVTKLSCFQEDKIKEPQDAAISQYESGKGYHIVSADEGNRPDPEKVKSLISAAVMDLKTEVSLDEGDAYKKPQITADDPDLVSQVQTLNRYTNVKVTYQFGDKKEVLNGDTISKWVGVGEDGKAFLSSSEVTAYVKGLASKYDTVSKAKTLNTSYGKTVKITGGSYGWKIDQKAEADELAGIIRSGESQERVPVYKQEAASFGENDYGNTYVEVNLTAQHLYFYKDGKLVLDTDFVSGNESKGWSTPAGVYSLTYKQKDATLKGEDYRTPVAYWMPFNGNIGFHDATWRKQFGGSIFKTSGSHGCVNLPPAMAKTLFENIPSKVPVLCYNLPGTESKTTSNGTTKTETTATTPATTPSTTSAPATAAATTAAPTTAAPTTAAPTTEAPATSAVTTPSTQETPVMNNPQQEAGPGVSKSTKKKTGPGVK
ncbi:peptidoglycan-binding protein [Lacrimispora amygdalina]|uniref:Peptidoglycan-binding protein n=1 Tax=Lacrimispora amygdalina TaxID=253257 RepID=A0ABQ5M2A0_9FIRM